MYCSPELLKLIQISLHRQKIDIEIAVKNCIFYTYIHTNFYIFIKSKYGILNVSQQKNKLWDLSSYKKHRPHKSKIVWHCLIMRNQWNGIDRPI